MCVHSRVREGDRERDSSVGASPHGLQIAAPRNGHGLHNGFDVNLAKPAFLIACSEPRRAILSYSRVGVCCTRECIQCIVLVASFSFWSD